MLEVFGNSCSSSAAMREKCPLMCNTCAAPMYTCPNNITPNKIGNSNGNGGGGGSVGRTEDSWAGFEGRGDGDGVKKGNSIVAVNPALPAGRAYLEDAELLSPSSPSPWSFVSRRTADLRLAAATQMVGAAFGLLFAVVFFFVFVYYFSRYCKEKKRKKTFFSAWWFPFSSEQQTAGAAAVEYKGSDDFDNVEAEKGRERSGSDDASLDGTLITMHEPTEPAMSRKCALIYKNP